MSEPYLTAELDDGVVFQGLTGVGDRLLGVIGVQDKVDVFLIRHAYVRTLARRQGIGGQLLDHVTQDIDKPFLVGTWKAAIWAKSFYEKHGFKDVGQPETERLLKTYWSIPTRQIETSVVLADNRWRAR
jgi:GNAT superfamily N-acetyltransferase